MTEETSQPAQPEGAQPGSAEAAPATGDPRVDAALASLEGLGEMPANEHVEALGHVHQRLQEILDEVGEQSPARNPGPGQ